ncbi:hypothetical protein CBP52_11630 [Cellulomonas sp. PSBB021]|nr:hypothetical protein CBP52_11630 [Cellulomonas sp. PSBB021]
MITPPLFSEGGSTFARRQGVSLHAASTAASIGTVGDAYDNCLMESIIGLFKNECIKPGPFVTGPIKNLTDVEMATMAWVDRWNHRRLHSSIAMLTPTEAEAAHYAATTALHPEPQPA